MGNNVSSNKSMVDQMVDHTLRSARVEGAFRAVDRAMYYKMSDATVDPYADQPWRNGHLHLSAPCIYAKVVEALNLEPGLSFLNLGSGTGYLSTIVGLLIGPNGLNHGVELHAEVIDYAQNRLDKFMATSSAIDKFDFAEPVFVQGNCVNVNPNVQYDRVYLGASCLPEMAQFMKKLIKPTGGILVMPYEENLIRYTRVAENEWDQEKLFRVNFTEMVAQQFEDDKRQIELPQATARSLKELCRIVIRQQLRLKTNLMHPNLLNSDNVDRRRYRRTMASLAMRRVEERRQQARQLVAPTGSHSAATQHNYRNQAPATAIHSLLQQRQQQQQHQQQQQKGACCRHSPSARRRMTVCRNCCQKQRRMLSAEASRRPVAPAAGAAAAAASAETRMMTRLAMRQMKSASGPGRATGTPSSSSRAEATSDPDGRTENEDDDDDEDEDSEMAFFPSKTRPQGPSSAPAAGGSSSSEPTTGEGAGLLPLDELAHGRRQQRQQPALVGLAADESASSARGHDADLSSMSSSMSSFSDDDDDDESGAERDNALFLEAGTGGARAAPGERAGGRLRLADGWAEFLALAAGDDEDEEEGDEDDDDDGSGSLQSSSSVSSSLSSLDSLCLSTTSSSAPSSDAETFGRSSPASQQRPSGSNAGDAPVASRLRSKRPHLEPNQQQQEASSGGSSSSFHSAVSSQQQQQRVGASATAAAGPSQSQSQSQWSCCANQRRCCRLRARKCRWLSAGQRASEPADIGGGGGGGLELPEVGRLQPLAGRGWRQLSPTPPGGQRANLSISRRILLATGYNLRRNGTSLTLAGAAGERQGAAACRLQHMRQPILFMDALARSSGENWGRSWRSITLRGYMEALASGRGEPMGSAASGAGANHRRAQQSSQQRQRQLQLQQQQQQPAAGPSEQRAARLEPPGACKRKRRASSQSGDESAGPGEAAPCSRRCRRCRAWARPAINFARDTFGASGAVGATRAAADAPRVIMMGDEPERGDPLDQTTAAAAAARDGLAGRPPADSCDSITASRSSAASAPSATSATSAAAPTTSAASGQPGGIVPALRAPCQHGHQHRRCCHHHHRHHNHRHHAHHRQHHCHRHIRHHHRHHRHHRHHHLDCSQSGASGHGHGRHNCNRHQHQGHAHCRRHHASCRHRAAGHQLQPPPPPPSQQQQQQQQSQLQPPERLGDFQMRRRVERERRLAGLMGGRPPRKAPPAPLPANSDEAGAGAGASGPHSHSHQPPQAPAPPRARKPGNECEKYRNHISGYIRRLDLPRVLQGYLNYGRDFHLR